jgi:uncharacterized protein (DUF58 family)
LPDDLLLRLEKRYLATQRTRGGGLPGEHRGRRLNSSLEFADYRPYAPGDDFRRIDWNAYARLDSLLVKMPEAREDITLHLLLDVSRSMDWGSPGKLRYAQQVCGGLGYMGLCRLDAVRVGLLAGARALCSPLFRGKAQAPQLFRFLQQAPQAEETDLNTSLAAYLNAPFRPTDVAVVVSDLLWPDGCEQGVHQLLRAGLRLVIVHLLSAEEIEPDYVGDLELLDVENGSAVEVSATDDTLKRYRAELGNWLDEIREFCRRRGILYLPSRSDRPIEQALLGDFRHAGLLK